MVSALRHQEEPHRIEVVLPDVVLGTWRNVLMAEWRVQTTAAQVDDVRSRLHQLAEHHPTGVFYLALIRATAAPPDDEARRAIAEILRNRVGKLLGGAVVFDGSGFRGAFVRGVATSLVMLARPAFPFNVCSLEDAARHFAERSLTRGVVFEQPRFMAEVRAFRAATSARPSRAPA